MHGLFSCMESEAMAIEARSRMSPDASLGL
jgi:hypothetical protein